MSTTDQTTENASLPPHQAPVGANDDRANEKPTAFAERGLAENMLNTLEQIHDVLRGSTIAEERGKDVQSKFWATYKRVSNEYDDDFLERANDDMAIILTFAGLFSAVNSTFIVGMQPNPADTTNSLMLQLIKIVAEGPNAVNDIDGLSSSTGYPSSTVWMQTLAYASLSFSVLAAFGAVMGKQWLNSFKASRGRGSLEERGFQRQKRLDGLEYWHLQTVLGAFLVLLQISLLLFGLSLSANMWTQQRTISSVIISATALGILFYVGTILISVLHPDSPFQTAGSTLVGAVSRKIFQAFSDAFSGFSDAFSGFFDAFSSFFDAFSGFFYAFSLFFDAFSVFFDAFSVFFDAFSNEFFNAVCDAFPRLYPAYINLFYSTSTPNISDKSSPIRWILEISTNPEVVEAAAAMVPLVQWSPTMDASTAYGRLVDNLATCVGRPELFVTCGKAMAHLHVHSAVSGFPNYSKEYKTWCSWGDKSHFIRDAFTDAHRHHDQLKNLGNEGDRLKLQANARAALRTVVVYGWETCLSHPNEEELIWYGDLRWHHANGKTPSYEEFDWLIDYLVDRVPDETDDKTEDDETVGDALLALSGMHGLGSPTKRSSYVKALVRCMAPTRPSRVRHAALRAVSDAGEDLASIANDSMSQGLDATLLDELSRALSHQNSIPSSDFVDKRTCCYLQLISALTKNDEWCKRLTSDGLVEWCISSSLYDTVLASSMVLDKVFLTGILLHINPSGTDISPNPVQEKKWMLVNSAWAHRHSFNKERIEALPALVAVTRQNLPDFTRAELADLASAVHEALQSLKDRRRRGWLGRINVLLIDAALPIVQGLYDELSPYVEHPSASQHNNGS